MANDKKTVIESVQRIYATALLDLAQDCGAVESVVAEVKLLGEILRDSPDLVALLDSRVLTVEQRSAVIDRVFRNRVSDLLLRFLQVLNRKSRLGALPLIVVAFEQTHEERFGLVEIDAYVAQTLEASQEAQVIERLSTALGRKVILRQHIQPDLIGGLKLRIGDEIVDGSVVTQLKILREKMIAAGRLKASALAAAMPEAAV